MTQHELLFLGQTRRATQRDAPKIRSCGVGLGESRGDSAGALLADALAAPASSQASKSNPTRLRLRLTQRASTWPGSCSYSSCFLGFFQPCCIGSGRACMDSRGPATRMERFMVLGRISENWERFEKKRVVSVTRAETSRRSSDRGQLQPRSTGASSCTDAAHRLWACRAARERLPGASRRQAGLRRAGHCAWQSFRQRAAAAGRSPRGRVRFESRQRPLPCAARLCSMAAPHARCQRVTADICHDASVPAGRRVDVLEVTMQYMSQYDVMCVSMYAYAYPYVKKSPDGQCA